MRHNETKKEIDEIKKLEDKIKQKNLNYETNIYTYDFQQFETIRSFGDSIYTGKISIDEAEMDQTNLLRNSIRSNNKSRLRSKEDKDKNEALLINALYEDGVSTLNAFRSGTFPIKQTQGKRRPSMLALHPSDIATQLKILSPKQMLQRLPVALAQVKAGNTSENLLHEIRQILYSLYRAKEIT